MTLDELQENWKEYAIAFEGDGTSEFEGNIRRMNELFMVCWGKCEGGLLFDQGGEQGAQGAILKADDEGNCYRKVFNSSESCQEDEKWEKVGRFLKLCPK